MNNVFSMQNKRNIMNLINESANIKLCNWQICYIKITLTQTLVKCSNSVIEL